MKKLLSNYTIAAGLSDKEVKGALRLGPQGKMRTQMLRNAKAASNAEDRGNGFKALKKTLDVGDLLYKIVSSIFKN